MTESKQRVIVGTTGVRGIRVRLCVVDFETSAIVYEDEKTKEFYRDRQGGRQFATCSLELDHLGRDRLLLVVFRRRGRNIYPASRGRLADKEKKKPENGKFKSAGF